jgi:hypothetical protein
MGEDEEDYDDRYGQEHYGEDEEIVNASSVAAVHDGTSGEL